MEIGRLHFEETDSANRAQRETEQFLAGRNFRLARRGHGEHAERMLAQGLAPGGLPARPHFGHQLRHRSKPLGPAVAVEAQPARFGAAGRRNDQIAGRAPHRRQSADCLDRTLERRPLRQADNSERVGEQLGENRPDLGINEKYFVLLGAAQRLPSRQPQPAFPEAVDRDD